MRAIRWSVGLLKGSTLLIAGTGISLAVAVAFVGALSSFVSSSRADLTVRAAARVPVDWQVQLTPSADPATVDGAIGGLPDVRARADVSQAAVPELSGGD